MGLILLNHVRKKVPLLIEILVGITLKIQLKEVLLSGHLVNDIVLILLNLILTFKVIMIHGSSNKLLTEK